MVFISGVSAVGPNTGHSAATGRQEIGQELFLQMLVTQLRYQDPLSGKQDTGELITQLTLFSLVEQVIKLQQTAERSERLSESNRALGMLNRNVEVRDESGFVAGGQVSAVSFKANQPYITVNGREYPLFAVIRVEGDV